MGLLRDIGKAVVPREILCKTSRYRYDRNTVHTATPRAGHDITKAIEFPYPVAAAILQHHEKMDGSGYLRGLSTNRINPEAKILAIVEMVENMIFNQPYQPASGIEAALKEIEINKEILCDAQAAEVCLKLFREKGFGFD